MGFIESLTAYNQPIKLTCVDQQYDKLICFTIDRENRTMSSGVYFDCLIDVVDYIIDECNAHVLFDIELGRLNLIRHDLADNRLFNFDAHRLSRDEIIRMNNDRLTLFGLYNQVYRYKVDQ